MDTQQWLTARQTTARFGLSRATLGRLIRRGEIVAAHPVPKRLLIEARSVEALLERRRVQPAG